MRIVVVAVAAAALVLGVAPAQANGRFPASNQILFSPSDPNLIVLRATFGILVSHDGGTTWVWICEDALGIAPLEVEDPAVGLTATNVLVAGLRGGLDVSSDTGCNWAYAGGRLSHQLVDDVVVRPDNRHVVLAGISTFDTDAGEAGTGGYNNQIFRSTDDGANWASLGVPFDPSLDVTTFDVAASDPNRLYVAGSHVSVSASDGSGARSFSMMISMNAGAKWSEVPLPLDPLTDQEPFIAAVDPTDANRVYVRSLGQQSRLFVTENAGQTFEAIFSLSNPIAGFALSPDGSTIYAGSIKDGLFVGKPSGGSFQNVSTIQVGCLAARAGELWACSTAASGFDVGVSTDDGATFTPKLHFADIDGPIVCGGDATASPCGPSSTQFSTLCVALGNCWATGALATDYDGGPPTAMATLCRSGPNCPCEVTGNCLSVEAGGDGGEDSDVDASMRSAPAARAGCGCSVVGGGGTVGLVALGALAVAAARRRRRHA